MRPTILLLMMIAGDEPKAVPENRPQAVMDLESTWRANGRLASMNSDEIDQASEPSDVRVTSPVPDSLAPRQDDVTVIEARRATGPLGNDWRYVRHGGRHWYWMPNKTWRLWTGTSWAPYPADMANPGSSETQSHLQMQGYRQPVAAAGAYAVPGGETSSRPKQYKPRDGTLPLGKRTYSPTVGPKQGLTPQDTKLLPQSTPDR